MRPSIAAAVTCGVLLCPLSRGHADTFSAAIGGSGVDAWGSGVAELPGGEICAVVLAHDWYDYSFGEPWLIVLDEHGDIVWSRVLGRDVPVSRDLESGGLLRPLADGSVLVAVQGEPRATGIDADACIMKLTPGTGMDWFAVMGAGDDGVYAIADLVAFEDGSFAAVCNEGCGSWVPRLSIHDPGGNFLGSFALQDSSGYFFAADATPDGRLVMAGKVDWWPEVYLFWIDLETAAMTDSVLVCYDIDEIDCLMADASGRIWLCGSDQSSPRVACFEPDGTPIWSETLEEPGRFNSITEAEGGAVCCGSSAGCGTVVRYSSDGRRLWTRLYDDGAGWASFEAVSARAGGGYVLSGTTSAGSDEMSGRAWIMSVDAEGLLEGCPYDPAADLYRPSFIFRQLDSAQEGWIVACGVYDVYNDADKAALYAAEGVDLPPEVVWIPDWPSLSGYEGWLAGLVPEGLDEPGWEQKAALILEDCPDAYLVWLGMTSESRRRELVADD